MTKNDVFPSPWIRAEDLGDEEFQFKIKSVEMEELTNNENKKERKPVATFFNQEKKLILSKTNWDRIEAQYGPDSDGWIGKVITLYAEPEKQSKSGFSARVKPMKAKPAGALRPAAPAPAVAEDDIPS